jgi:cell division protein FtsL
MNLITDHGKIKAGDVMQGIVNRWFEIIIIGIFTYGATTLSSMSQDIAQLNKSIAVILEKVTYQQKTSDDHEQRLRDLERK